jgi:hypothetical protein
MHCLSRIRTVVMRYSSISINRYNCTHAVLAYNNKRRYSSNDTCVQHAEQHRSADALNSTISTRSSPLRQQAASSTKHPHSTHSLTNSRCIISSNPHLSHHKHQTQTANASLTPRSPPADTPLIYLAPAHTLSTLDQQWVHNGVHYTHHKHHTNTHSTRHSLLALGQQVPRRGLVLLARVAHAEAVLRAREAGLAGAAQEERLSLPAQRVVYTCQAFRAVNQCYTRDDKATTPF